MAIIGFTLLVLTTLLTPLISGCDRSTSGSENTDPPIPANVDAHGHTHGEGDAAGPVTVTLFSDGLQLFMEYPQLVQGKPAEFLAHLTVLATGEPIRLGSLTCEVTPPSGEARALTWPTPRREGLFVPEWEFDQVGAHRLRLILDSPQMSIAEASRNRVIDVGDVIVHASKHDAQHAAELDSVPEPPNLVPLLLEQQWALALRHDEARRRTLVHHIQIPGRIVAPQGASAAVAAPVAGRLLPPEDGTLPKLGDIVRAGGVIARIEPSLAAPEAVQFATNRTWLEALRLELAQRSLDLQTKAAEVQRTLVQSSAKLEYERQSLDRTSRLMEKGIASEQQLDEARQNLALAKAEHQAALALQEAYEKARDGLRDLESKWSSARRPVSPVGDTIAFPVHAPITGEVVSVAHIEGEHLEADHREIFRIVNLEHVWVSANISEFDLAALSSQPGAIMKLAAYPERRFDILASGGRLVHIGKIVEADTRTVSVTYELPNAEGLFRIGMFADVFIEAQKATEALAVPEDAVVMERGRPIAFVLFDGEHFTKRTLVTGIRADGYVEVIEGVEPGERVVTHSAYALKLASLAPSSFGHGHVH